MEKKFRCHKISEGIVEGEALVSGDNIMFYLIEPDTGKVIEPALCTGRAEYSERL